MYLKCGHGAAVPDLPLIVQKRRGPQSLFTFKHQSAYENCKSRPKFWIDAVGQVLDLDLNHAVANLASGDEHARI